MFAFNTTYNHSIDLCTDIMTANAVVLTTPVVTKSVSSYASNSSAMNATHIMAPPANHNPTGSSGKNECTNINAGTAING